MAAEKEYTIKYHHGGTLLKEGEIKYVNGLIDEVTVDLEKTCYWDLLGDLKEVGHDITNSVNLFFIDASGALKVISDDEGIMGLVDHLMRHWTADIYVEFSSVKHNKTIPESLMVESEMAEAESDVELNMNDDMENENGSDSAGDDEERIVDDQLFNNNSDEDEEREEAIKKVNKYVKLKKRVQEVASERDNLESYATNKEPQGSEFGKVGGYESDYFESSDPGSYSDNSSGSEADDAVRHKSSRKIHDPTIPLEEFRLDLRFSDLKEFKNTLVDFSTRKGFEFKYIKNDTSRVRAKCSAKDCSWLILCSWCSTKKIYVVKHYVSTHSCLLGVTKNKRVTAQVVVKKFGDVIASMPVIKPRHLKALVRKETGVFVTDKVCKNAKRLVLKKVEQQFIEDFKVLNSYALELKASNPGSNVVIVSERLSPNALPTFQKMYICLTAAREGFLASCRRIIGLDGCFLKGLMKGQLLVAVGRDGNNQMFPIAWAIVEKETTESWSWFLKLL